MPSPVWMVMLALTARFCERRRGFHSFLGITTCLQHLRVFQPKKNLITFVRLNVLLEQLMGVSVILITSLQSNTHMLFPQEINVHRP